MAPASVRISGGHDDEWVEDAQDHLTAEHSRPECNHPQILFLAY